MASAAQHPTSQDVLQCAARVLAESGPGALSVRRLAARLGVSYQVVYSRFGDKSGLVDALYRHGFDLLGERLDGVTEPLGTTQRIVALGQAYRAAALAEPELYGVMFGRPVPGYVPSARSLLSAWASYQPVVEAIEACLSAGTLVPTAGVPDASSLAYLCWSTGHGIVSLELSGHAASARAPEGARLIDAAVSALLAPHLPVTSDPPADITLSRERTPS